MPSSNSAIPPTSPCHLTPLTDVYNQETNLYELDYHTTVHAGYPHLTVPYSQTESGNCHAGAIINIVIYHAILKAELHLDFYMSKLLD